MLNMTISCPLCQMPIEVKSSDFDYEPPIYDENALVAHKFCPGHDFAIRVVIYLEEDEAEDCYHIDHIQVDTEPLTAS